MERLFADCPEAVANTGELALRLGFTLKDLGYRFPDYPLPRGETPLGFLRQLAHAGARDRYGSGAARREGAAADRARAGPHRPPRPARATSSSSGTSSQYCRAHDMLVQGRGSAANSAVCYALGLTAVDPVGMELLFERFLSEERGEWPDIDLDLPSGDRRETRDPVRLRALRAPRRGHDRQRDHLSRSQRGPRGRQDPGPARRHDRAAVAAREQLGVHGSGRQPARAPGRGRLRSRRAAHAALRRGSGAASRTCRGTSASTRAAW